MDTPLLSPSHGIRLADILNNATFIGVDDVITASCCGHWTDCQQDDLYVAIVGPEHDGHDFAHEAIHRAFPACSLSIAPRRTVYTPLPLRTEQQQQQQQRVSSTREQQ